MQAAVPQAGTPGPEHKTSTIVEQDKEFSFDLELETGICYFNDVVYRIGDYVCSGNELLRCEE